MRKQLLLFASVLPLFASLVAAGDKPLKVFICAGQSNMLGKRSVAARLPKELQTPAENVLAFHRKNWKPLKPGGAKGKGFGPEVSFAHTMAKAMGEPIGIIKHSKGGTNLAEQWNPEKDGPLYSQLKKLVAAARKSRKIEIVGMLWLQGEKDSRDGAMAKAYADNLPELIAAARKDFDAPKMFFIAGRVNPPKPKYAHVDLVRKAQEECKANGYAWIDADSASKIGDKVHYDTAGIVELGNRYAEAMLKLMKKGATSD